MKTKTFTTLMLGGLLTVNAFSVSAERVLYRDLPNAAQKVMKMDKDDIKRIESFSHNGKMVYEIQLGQSGPDKFIYLSDDGALLSDASLRNERLAQSTDLKLGDLPKPVAKTFKNQTKSAKVTNISVETASGKPIYAIEYSEKNDRTAQIRINEDGSLAQASQTVGVSGESQTVASFDRPLAATQKVDFQNVPEAVKQTVRRIAGSNRVEDAERGRLDGKTIYEIAFKQNGKHNELRVTEDGAVVQRVSAEEVRFPGSLSINEVPEPVRRSIREHVGSGEVNDIDKKTIDGKTVYEVGFKMKSGAAQQEIQIAEDGTFLGEASGAENK